MDKLEGWKGSTENKVNEIIDWINASDERDAGVRAMLNDVKGGSIEQELEAGLMKAQWDASDHAITITRIFLPMAKYEEYMSNRSYVGGEAPWFRDIPVFSYSGDEIIYCTD